MSTLPPRAGDVVEQVFDVAYRRLVVQLHGICGTLPEAEEVVQEAFVKAVAMGRRFETIDNPVGWLRTVAVNQARSRHRRRQLGAALHVTSSRMTEIPSPDDEDSVRRMTLEAALRTLPRSQREAIALFHLADLSLNDVAETLGVPPGTVKARLSRGRATLATLLTEAAITDQTTVPAGDQR